MDAICRLQWKYVPLSGYADTRKTVENLLY